MIAAIAALGAMALSCESSDPTAPQGSTITVTADPQTVASGTDSTITATVRSSNGTRLPDQEVIFSTTRGNLTPPAQSSQLTDSNGQVTSLLSTSVTATVTATSGTTSGSTTVNFVNCDLQTIIVNLSEQVISDCSPDPKVVVFVTARDSAGAVCEGLAVSITADPPVSGATHLLGSLSPTQGVTDSGGLITAKFTPDASQCQNDCSGGQVCEVDFVAEDRGGSIQSVPVTLTASVN
jgi:hypothetical protein